ncbi:hypothetical protein L2E82_29764 [Cichorium intybus]|uniref:Uncharacterized protein n=1 Tax=Cichorium intybus TaxID=13427 RepID=A0ACB9CYV3_CICIN|nr:hypothetical protein L2E82_29764 [Cichorium intybus]
MFRETKWRGREDGGRSYDYNNVDGGGADRDLCEISVRRRWGWGPDSRQVKEMGSRAKEFNMKDAYVLTILEIDGIEKTSLAK